MNALRQLLDEIDAGRYPERLAIATLATRLTDLDSATRVLAESARFTITAEEL